MTTRSIFAATGRRKTSVARVRVVKGAGVIQINGRPIEGYFPKETMRRVVMKPLDVTESLGKFDVYVTVRGGGLNGQAGAVNLGIARALKEADPALKALLSKENLLSRDPRMKERKKYGQPGARKRFQFSKR